jgi:hypothetical protein
MTNQPNQNALVQQLFEMTQAIEHTAAMADWAETARLMKARMPLLRSLSPKQEPAALELIRRIRAIDASIGQEAKLAQTELGQEYGVAMNRVNATRAYHRTARL